LQRGKQKRLGKVFKEGAHGKTLLREKDIKLKEGRFPRVGTRMHTKKKKKKEGEENNKKKRRVTRTKKKNKKRSGPRKDSEKTSYLLTLRGK